MTSLPDPVARLLPTGRLTMAFAALLLVHVLAGLTCVAAGAVAMTSPKRAGRHPRFGTLYFSGLAVIFATATGMSLLRWPEDAYLLALGTLSFGFGSLGFAARKVRWRGWRSAHIVGMSLSYVVLLTAFYVDNGPHLPLYDRLPSIAFWTVPSLVALPLVVRALRRHTRVWDDLRAMAP
jgi:hypothetical protein